MKQNKEIKNLDDILDILRANWEILENKYKVHRIGIFGSRARGDNQRYSDIDILVEFSEPVGLFLFSGLRLFLESILKLEVDLATLNTLRDEFRENVLREVAYAWSLQWKPQLKNEYENLQKTARLSCI